MLYTHRPCAYIQFNNVNLLFPLYIYKHTLFCNAPIPPALLKAFFLWIYRFKSQITAYGCKKKKKSEFGKNWTENLWVEGVENWDYLGIKIVR